MFKKALAALGIGGASIDAVLESTTAVPGGKLQGTINIRGGSLAQEIRSIELSVETDDVQEHDEHKSTHPYALGRYRIPQAVRVEPGSQQQIPFTIDLPWGAPLSLGNQRCWLATRLEVEGAIDPKDRDEIGVRPAPLQARLLEAMQALGFQVRQARCEKVAAGARRAVRTGDRDEARGLGSLFAEMLEMDESRLRLSFTDADLAQPAAQWAARIQGAIQSHA